MEEAGDENVSEEDNGPHQKEEEEVLYEWVGRHGVKIVILEGLCVRIHKCVLF